MSANFAQTTHLTVNHAFCKLFIVKATLPSPSHPAKENPLKYRKNKNTGKYYKKYGQSWDPTRVVHSG